MSNPLSFKIVDAFARAPYSGNVAGVVFDADALEDKQMQNIAAEFNASETAFVLKPTMPDAALRIRWFTPGCEVDFCGHATLGAVHAVVEAGQFASAFNEPGTILPIETRSGILTVRLERGRGDQSNTYWLDMPHNEPKSDKIILPPLLAHLGITSDDIDPALPPICTQDDHVILAIRALPTLLEMQPNMSELRRYGERERVRGVLVTTTNVLTPATVVQSRFFAPAVGVDEDPVTGSVHGPLGLHLVNSGVATLVNGRADFHCAQAKSGGRAGLVRIIVTATGDGPKEVRIGGTCITTAEGVLRLS